MQNINNLKDKVINLKDIIVNNLQDENKLLKTKVIFLENEVIDLEVPNSNVDQYSRRNKVFSGKNIISGILQQVSDNYLKKKLLASWRR